MAVMRTAFRFSSPTTRSQIRQVNTVSQYQKGGAIDTVFQETQGSVGSATEFPSRCRFSQQFHPHSRYRNINRVIHAV